MECQKVAPCLAFLCRNAASRPVFVQFLDRTLLRLTDATERSAVFTPAVGDRLLSAAFAFRNVEVGEVTGVSVRDIEILPAVTEHQQFNGTFMDPVSAMRWDASGQIGAVVPHAVSDARLDVLLTTETRIADTSVTRLESSSLEDLASLDAVDARIVAEDGSLPTAAGPLALRRFTALKGMLHERFTVPDDFDVDGFFERKHIDNVDQLLAFLSPPRHPERIEMELVIDGTLPSRIVNHRVVAATHIEENPIARLHATIDAIQVNRTLLVSAIEAARPPSGMEPRTALPFVLIFDAVSLDDDDLPFPTGVNPTTAPAKRNARLTELQTRLTPFGIALAPIDQT
jgi:hypothetical protein